MTNYEEKVKKFLVLAAIKESYLFLRNLYGLRYHPFKTIRQIRRENDWSQTILVLGLPIYLWFGGLLFSLGATFFFWKIWQWEEGQLLVFGLFILFSLGASLLSFYILFWFGQYFLRCQKL
ncbi:MAG: hypothetical protein ACOZBZ_04740 [Patescibacteria group bacterium]